MAIITKPYTFGADICNGCGKKNKLWMKKNFHNKKCLAAFMIKTAKLYNGPIPMNNSNLPG